MPTDLKTATPKHATTRNDDYFSTETVKVDFEHKDRLGRVIGAFVRNSTHVWAAKTETELAADAAYAARWDIPAENMNRGELPAGTVRFGFSCGALRNGKSHQARHYSKLFATEAQRDAAKVKYLADAAKRAAKGSAKA